MAKTEYVKVSQEGLIDFKGLILPNIYEQLITLDSFEQENILAVGAVEHLGDPAPAGEDIPLGLAVGGLKAHRELFLYSIVVAEDSRRRGIGTGLLEHLMGPAAEKMTGALTGDLDADIFVHADYALPESECREFRAFLEAAGFRDFEEGPDIYLLDAEKIPAAPVFPDLHFLSPGEAEREDLLALFGSLGLAYDPDCCVYTGDESAPRLLVLAELQGNDILALSSRSLSPVSGEEYAAAVKAVAEAARRKYGRPTLSVSLQFNEQPLFWQALAREAGECFKRTEAGMYAVFS